uniref:Cilia- and flagella-associated protein 43 n=1 Tax=Odontella aurita TaxID=265563 RepID=A0A7S4N6N6_9STRA
MVEPAHCGGISYIRYEAGRDGNGSAAPAPARIVTSGSDGYIRWWDALTIQSAEVDLDVTIDFPLCPVRSFCVGSNVLIGDVMHNGSSDRDKLLVLDKRGSLLRVSLDDAEIVPIWHFHGGPLVGLATSPSEHLAVTACLDGSLRCWNYLERKFVAETKFEPDAGCTCVGWLPMTSGSRGTSSRVVFVGFSDGVVRCLYISRESFIQRDAVRPHTGAVRLLAFGSEGKFLASSGDDGIIFFFRVARDVSSKQVMTPVGFFESGPISSMTWKPIASEVALLCTTKQGQVFEVDLSCYLSKLPSSAAIPDTYRLNVELTYIPLRSEARNYNESEGDGSNQKHSDDGNDERGCACAVYSQNGSNILWTDRRGVCHEYDPISGGNVARFHFGQSSGIIIGMSIGFGPNGDGLLSFGRDGFIFLLPSCISPKCCYVLRSHDANDSRCHVDASLSWDKNFVLSSGADGLLVVYRVDQDMMDQRSVADEDNSSGFNSLAGAPEGSDVQPAGFAAIPPTKDPAILDSLGPAENDRTRGTTYSIEEEKLKKQRDSVELAAKRKKNAIVRVVADLRKEYSAVLKENTALPPVARLAEDDLVVDPGFYDTLEDAKTKKSVEVENETEYESERSMLRRKKLENFFFDSLAPAGKSGSALVLFEVVGLRDRSQRVQSFPTKKIHNILLEAMQAASINVEYTKRKDSIATSTEDKRNTPTETTRPVDQDSSNHLQKEPIRSSTFEFRKRMRAERKQGIIDKTNSKPDENADDPRDMAAIQNAKESLGDYKYKGEQSSPRGNVLEEMSRIESTVHRVKSQFNERLCRARDKRQELVAIIQAKKGRIERIDSHMNNPCERRLNTSKGSTDLGGISFIEAEELEENRKLLHYEKESLVLQIEEMYNGFDDSLYELRKHRSRLAKEVKEAELQQLQMTLMVVRPRRPSVINTTSKQLYVWAMDGKATVLSKDDVSHRSIFSGVPEDCVVFTTQQLETLRCRIASLECEIIADKKQLATLKTETKRLDDESREKEDEIQKQRERCEGLQQLKFGQLAKQLPLMDMLDEICLDSSGEVEFKEKAEKAKRAFEANSSKRVNEQRAIKGKLLDATNKNTAVLKQLATLNERQLSIEREFSKMSQEADVDESAVRSEVEECQELETVISAQANEIERLKREIKAMSRKDCHIFPPVSSQGKP